MSAHPGRGNLSKAFQKTLSVSSSRPDEPPTQRSRPRVNARPKRYAVTLRGFDQNTGRLCFTGRTTTTRPTWPDTLEVVADYLDGDHDLTRIILVQFAGSFRLYMPSQLPTSGAGHWLGCTLDPSHEGDCAVARRRP